MIYDKPNLYFGNITSLSEIRYAASIGAKYIGLRVDEKTSEEYLLELIKWVEAECFILELCESYSIEPLKFRNAVNAKGLSYDYTIAKDTSKVKLLYSVVRYNEEYKINEFLKFIEENLDYLEGFIIDAKTVVNKINLVSKLKKLNSKLFLEMNDLSDEAMKIILKLRPNTLLMNGIGEESVGMYDYDYFERVLEFHSKIV